MSGFKPPDSFDFTKPEQWPQWRQRFMRYHTCAELSRKSFDIQVSSLIYSMGMEAEKVYSTFNIVTQAPRPDTEDPPVTTFKDVVTMFDNHFNPRVNVIHERAQFHQRNQQPGESVEGFVRALYDLAEHAQFDDKDTAIRDRLVVGLRDKDLSEKLQLQPGLTLQHALQQARQHEQVKGQLEKQRALNNSVDAVHSYTHGPRGGRGGYQSHGNASSTSRGGQTHRRGNQGGGRGRGTKRGNFASGGGSVLCDRCNRDNHKNSSDCPARGKTCRICGKANHFAVCCRSGNRGGNISSVEEPNMTERFETWYLGSVENNATAWYTNLNIQGREYRFKIDTGADVSIMSVRQYRQFCLPPLSKTKAILKSPGGPMNNIAGEFTTSVKHRENTMTLRIIVVDADTDNLLSREASAALGLVQRVDNVFGPLGGPPVQCEPVKIKLHNDVEPYSIPTARRVPIPLIEKVKQELQEMKELGIIEEIKEATDWCAPMVPVAKKNGRIRICTDFKRLNSAIKRERYILPTIDDLLHQLTGARIFSKLDATSGFWQLPLDEETAKLTTFITPCGRFFYKRLPFGISSAPEIFQRTVEEILQGVGNVICYFDDILVYSQDAESHERHLSAALDRLQSVGLKLNQEKCQFRKTEIEFLGHLISGEGIKPHPDKVQAISNLPDPSNVTELKRVLGMINFLGRYLPHLSTTLRPLSQLLESDTEWSWGGPQIAAMAKVKENLSKTPVLAYFDLNRETVVSSDASSFGIGAVLLQDHDGVLKPVAYCSRTLTSTEKGYAQIEKELLAAVWACEKFNHFLMGLESFSLETDHKPLIPLINTKDLHEVPLRCQRLLMRLMRYKVIAHFSPGKKLVVADALSRSPQPATADKQVDQLMDDVAAHVDLVQSTWPASDAHLDKIATETHRDAVLNQAFQYTTWGWPIYKRDVDESLHEIFAVRSELSVHGGLLLKGNRIVIPASMRKETLEAIHSGHQGIAKCRERASSSVWWPGIARDIEQTIKSCSHCEQRKPTQRAEPLSPTPLPARPFQMVGADIFEHRGSHYLVVLDYFSRQLEIAHLSGLTSKSVIGKLKNIFAHNGIPELVVSDNGPQFTSADFKTFSTMWKFGHVTSSPYFPQSNGEAERGVQLAKNILDQEDPFLALLSYRDTPTGPTRMSPSLLNMGRRLRTTVPTLPINLEPAPYDRDLVAENDAKAKLRNKKNFDQHHGAQSLPDLQPGDVVLQKLDHEPRWSNPATVLSKVAPHSFLVRTLQGAQYRRNRKHLRLSSQSFTPGSFTPTASATFSQIPLVPGIPFSNVVPRDHVPTCPSPQRPSQATSQSRQPEIPMSASLPTVRPPVAEQPVRTSPPSPSVMRTPPTPTPPSVMRSQPTPTPTLAQGQRLASGTTRSGRTIVKPLRFRQDI